MTTVSLDLRGSGPLGHSDFLPETKARGAGLSVALHSAGIAVLVLAPLLSAVETPEPMTVVPALLVKPIVVALPSAPINRRPPRGGPARAAEPKSQAQIGTVVEVESPLACQLTPHAWNA